MKKPRLGSIWDKLDGMNDRQLEKLQKALRAEDFKGAVALWNADKFLTREQKDRLDRIWERFQKMGALSMAILPSKDRGRFIVIARKHNTGGPILDVNELSALVDTPVDKPWDGRLAQFLPVKVMSTIAASAITFSNANQVIDFWPRTVNPMRDWAGQPMQRPPHNPYVKDKRKYESRKYEPNYYGHTIYGKDKRGY